MTLLQKMRDLEESERNSPLCCALAECLQLLLLLDMSNSQVHAAVLRFLLQNGYRETQEAFVREAGDLIDFDNVEDAPPLHRLFLTRDNIDEDQQLADRMSSLRVER